jgi:hypothetical protein
MAALFPNDTPVTWEGDDLAAETKDKRKKIESYIKNKMNIGGFRTEVSKLVYDFIDYGNVFGIVEYVNEHTKDSITGEKIQGFSGPRLRRISPLDIVFNPIAERFSDTPKIVRSLMTLGDLKETIETRPEMKYLEDVFKKTLDMRAQVASVSTSDTVKNANYIVAGIGNYLQYLKSDYVEILDFYGNIYDPNKKEYRRNVLISIVDRAYIIRDIDNPSWLGSSDIFHAGWRLCPDTLYAMGPLENLVGMQYRIDHLENAKADAFDLMIHPVIKIRGFVEDFEYGPDARIIVDNDGDVEFMRPDYGMLNADTQIAFYEAKMEEMAGAPKQAMGFRTPGEKTAYEVQILENGANKIFLNKTSYFEEAFIEPVLMSMLEIARRSMGTSDIIRVFDDEYGAVDFLTITKEDITAKGKIRPIAARRFARNSNLAQNLTQFFQSTIGQDPAVSVHISGLKIAQIMQELLGLDKFDLVKDNVRIQEMLETEKFKQTAQEQIMMENAPENESAMVSGPSVGQTGPV